MSHATLLLVLVILVSSVVSQQQQQQPDDTPDICLSLRDSSACPAFHQFYVSTGVVDRFPFLPSNITTVQQLDASLLRYVNSTSDYLLPLGCLSTNYNPTTPYARYALTKMCARLIQDAEDSLPCNTEHNVVPPPLCQATCMDWVNSVTVITSQPRVCSDNSQRTAALANYTTQCLSWQGYNASTDDNCISGFANEPDNCGFRDDITRACQFCQNTTSAASSNCCQLVTCGHGLGDVIMLALPFDDGWALGVNLSTGLKGAFPLVCVSPTTLSFMEQWQSRSSKLTLPSTNTIDTTITAADVSSSSIPKRMASKSSKSTSSSDFISLFWTVITHLPLS
ncbi:hypothetical protein BCR42DRAFT_489822 [Absidia repens]|uniref:SH3 domain-containing protein n=1 Tax=Absidia repens TaxID=90262 RepID=A0A1X2IMK5_9FUNG|nr:hypothetical protein BCR42DRAFT_489822 [Absidia repens]